jgi:DNA-binding MarR family transcriptional regulator
VSAGSRPGAGGSEQTDPAAGAWQAMRRLVLDLHDRRSAVAEELGMSYLRAKALRRLHDGPLSQRELSAALMTDAPYTTVMIDDLEQRGLVQRQVNPADRRSKLVSITRAGRTLAERSSQITGAPPAALDVLSVAELRELERMLRLVVEGSQPEA